MPYEKELECPYCHHYNDEPDDNHEQDETYFCTCEKCDKVFGYSFQYLKVFHEFVTPCQNADEHGNYFDHKWKKIKGSPEKYFIGKYRCEYCDEHQTFNTEEINQLNLEI